MVFGLFSKDRQLKRTIERATNKLAQSQDRWAAMEKLREIGTDEALYALCRRFSFTYDKSIEDQQEKAWVVETLATKGEASLGALKRYMKGASSLGYPLQILQRITSKERILEAVDELLADEEPGYVRDPKRRIDIIEWLGEWEQAEDDEVVSRVVPYLEDFDENVRFKSVETIALRPCEAAAEPLVRALVREEEESIRLKQRIASVIAANDMPLGDKRDAVSELVSGQLEGFVISKSKLKASG